MFKHYAQLKTTELIIAIFTLFLLNTHTYYKYFNLLLNY